MTAHVYRARAFELRARASTLHDLEMRKAFLDLANEYDALAFGSVASLEQKAGSVATRATAGDIDPFPDDLTRWRRLSSRSMVHRD